MKLDRFIGLRVPKALHARYERLAQHKEHRGRDVTTLQRMALEDWLEAEEKRLGLAPLSAEELALNDAPPKNLAATKVADRPAYRKNAPRDKSSTPKEFPKG